MRISDWSSDVCSSDLVGEGNYNRNDSLEGVPSELIGGIEVFKSPNASLLEGGLGGIVNLKTRNPLDLQDGLTAAGNFKMSKGSEIGGWEPARSEEHTSELQSLMRNSYAVLCLKNNK